MCQGVYTKLLATPGDIYIGLLKGRVSDLIYSNNNKMGPCPDRTSYYESVWSLAFPCEEKKTVTALVEETMEVESGCK